MTLPDRVLDVSPSAPIVVNIAHITNARIAIKFTFNPLSLDASLLPPTAKKLRPTAVLVVNTYKMTATTTIRMTA